MDKWKKYLKKALEFIAMVLVIFIIVAVMFLSYDLGKYNTYKDLYEKGEVQEYYEDFNDFLSNWDGNF